MKAGAKAVKVAMADSQVAVNEAGAMELEAGRWAKVGAKAVKVAMADSQVAVNEAEAMGQVGRWVKVDAADSAVATVVLQAVKGAEVMEQVGRWGKAVVIPRSASSG